MLHQSFAQGLQVQVDAQRKVFASFRFLVEGAILIFPLNASVGIAQQDLNTLFATQLLFVRALNTQFADVVACLIVVVLLNV